jgi:alpha-tubulin suppressor-like RCC1 family protein
MMLAGCDKLLGFEHVEDAAVPPDVLAPGNWAQVAAGFGHTCAIEQLDGSLWCWGDNEYGELGVGSPEPEIQSPTRVGTAAWKQVAAGGVVTCGIQSDDTLWCWGFNNLGQLGSLASGGASTTPLAIAGAWKQVWQSGTAACAIRADSTLWCWGSDLFGQLGQGTSGGTMAQPVQVPGSWLQVVTGSITTCAIDDTHHLWCWGASPGDGGATQQNAPVQITGETYERVAAGGESVCALRSDHRLRCWGDNTYGSLGDGTTTGRNYPTIVADDSPEWVDVAVGARHACARRMDSSLWCWGDNGHGQLLLGALPSLSSAPLRVDVGHVEWTGIATGGGHTCAVSADHNLWCAGADGFGQLGDSPQHRIPSQVAGSWRAVFAGGSNTCAQADDDSLSCWGDNLLYQVGDASNAPRAAPVPLGPGPHDSVSPTYNYVCELRSGDRWCWGANQLGMYGNGTQLSSVVPEHIVGGGPWTLLDTNSDHACGITNAGTAWCWGYNNFHQVASDTAMIHQLPIQVAGGPYKSLGAGLTHNCAAAVDGSVWCWGNNDVGQIGNGTITPAPSPVMIAIPFAATTTVASRSSSCALDATGAAACWGDTYSGELGTGTQASVLAPARIPGTWRQLALGAFHSCAVATDRTLWCWGTDARGQLGDGGSAMQLSQLQISADPTWDTVAVGENHSCATKVDHSLWCWGENQDGELGNGLGWRTQLAIIPAP